MTKKIGLANGFIILGLLIVFVSYWVFDKPEYQQVPQHLPYAPPPVYKASIPALLSSIAQAVNHGDGDSDLTPTELTIEARTRKVSLVCGEITHWAQYLLAERAPTRRVNFLKEMDGGYYGYSHSLLEIFLDGKWAVYDLDMNCYFVKDGEPLSLYEFSQGEDYEIVFIAIDSTMTEKEMREWYKENMECISINRVFFDNHNVELKIIGGTFTYLPEEKWKEMFYDEKA